MEFKIDSIKLDEDVKELVEISIIELQIPALMPEVYNSVISKDSSLIIKHYPSFEWESFQNIKN